MLSLWRLPEFGRFYFLSVLAWLAVGFYSFLIPLVVLEKTGSVFAMSVAKTMEFLPQLLLASFSGFLVDLYNPKKILIFGLFGQIFAAIFIVLILYTGANWPVYLGLFAFMTCNLMFNNARTVTVKFIIKRDAVMGAISLFQVTSQFIKVVAPILAGVLTMFVAYKTGLYVTCGVLFVALFFAFGLDVSRELKGSAFKPSFKKVFVEPVLMLKENARLMRFTVLFMFINLIEAASSITYIYILKSVLALDNELIGLGLSTAGLGAILGAAICPKLRKILGEERVIGFVITVMILCYILVFSAFNLYSVLFCIFMQNVCFMIAMLFFFLVRQEEAGHSNIGRITGATTTVFNLITPVGVPFTGFIISGYGFNYAFFACGVLCMLAYFIFKRMRKA